EHCFLNIGLEPAVGWIDERVRRASLKPGVLCRQVVLGRVIAERNFTGKGPNDLERAVELAFRLGRHGSWRTIATGKHDVDTSATFLCLHGPGPAAARVACGEMRDERRPTERHLFAVSQHPVDGM